MFGPKYTSKCLDGRVMAVEQRQKGKRSYTYLKCAFAMNNEVREVTLPLGQVKQGLTVYQERQYDSSQDDPLAVVNALFESDGSSTNSDGSDAEPAHAERARSSTSVDHPVSNQTSSARGGNAAGPSYENVPSLSRTAEAHGREWKTNPDASVLNREIPVLNARFRLASGAVLREGTAPETLSLYDVFLSMFPQEYLSKVVSWTTAKLKKKWKNNTTTGELLKFFGTLILISNCKFGSRRDLWKKKSPCKYLPAYNFGKIMSRSRFEAILSCISFGPDPNPNVTGRTAVEKRNGKVLNHLLKHSTSTGNRTSLPRTFSVWMSPYPDGMGWVGHG